MQPRRDEQTRDDQATKPLDAVSAWRHLPAALIGLGAALRLAHYLGNRSLWIDEAMLALSIIGKSPAELLRPLDYCQGSPVGFVLLARLATAVLGTSELALRLLPFLAGIASLFLFWMLAKTWLDRRAALFALALFALAEPLVYYSGEFKHYSTDLMWAVIVYLMLARVMRDDFALRGLLALAVTGVLAMWFSYPACFILPGVGVVLAVALVRRKRWAGLVKVSAMGAAWLAAFLVCYVAFLRPLAANPYQLGFWRLKFVPFASVGATAGWLRTAFMDFFQHTLGLPNSFGAANVGALVFLVGLWVTFRRDGEKLAFLVAPAALCLLAACLKKYPFDGRLLLFLAPSALLLMGPGAARLAGPCRRRFFRATGLVLVTCLYVPTAYDAVRSALPPYGKEEIRPVLQYIRAHEQPGDLVYVHWGAGPAFRYYHDYRGYEFEQWKAGICSDWNKPRYVEELDNLAHDDNVRRIWFLISHDRSHERAFFLETLDGMGTRADAFQTRGASAYLYELRGRKVIRRDDEPGRPSSGDGMQH